MDGMRGFLFQQYDRLDILTTSMPKCTETLGKLCTTNIKKQGNENCAGEDSNVEDKADGVIES